MRDIIDTLRDVEGIQTLIRQLPEGDDIAAEGPVSSAGALTCAALSRSVPAQMLVVCPGMEYAEEFAEDINLCRDGMACHFPALEVLPGDGEEPDEQIVRSRLGILRHLMFGTGDRSGEEFLEPRPHTRIVTTSINALLQPVCRPAQLRSGARSVSVGQRIGPRELVEWLVENDFYSAPQVEQAGSYSLRGGILDVFSHGTERPVRIEFFGDEIDSIRTFNPSTQLSNERVRSWQLVGAGDPLHDPTAGDSDLTAYFNDDTLAVVVEPTHLWQRARQLRGDMKSQEFLHDPARMRDKLGTHTRLQLCEPGEEVGTEPVRIECECRDVYGVDLESALDELERICAERRHVYVFCTAEAERERLSAILKERETDAEEVVRFREGRLNHGVSFPDADLALIPHHRLFGRYRQRRVAQRAGESQPVRETGELSPGDMVVHVQHGIARFRGMTVLERKGREQEHLELEFADDVRVYVPATRIELVHRYIGVGGRRPELSKLRGSRWDKQREKAEEAAEDLAAELLRLHAAREASPGIEFPPDGEWQRQFEAEFPYEETDDQLKAIASTKQDMQRTRPMDRLICGEVGYGKTEVAMRAAFKAVMGEHQVAVLVPTTVLAQQHYRTFRGRMADYPVRVEMLSRFVSGSETREIIEDMAAGKVDVVIGTHKLLQDDVQFRQLGLVIIDEEQRFGVKHKEKLKQMRTTVDVLTLTATPIPRTLHMALMGLRDISALQTPPRERQAIETKVRRFDPDVFRNAVRRELNRDGQTFVVHNRVHSIEEVAEMARELVPEATVAVAHGQMPERKLADVMELFSEGEIDLLVSTTIIENGLDIPNANTLIVNRAELLGLAEMHQLRGRVGRYVHKAYAYFFTPQDRPITPKARERLKAIRRYSQLGAGFDIALRDLELRGAGNILGPQQSGHIAAVGYNLYCRLLERATSRLKGESEELRELAAPPVANVNLGLDVTLPDDFIPGLKQRIEVYRKVGRASEEGELESLAEELRDRFGALPAAVQNLLLETRLRIKAARIGISAIHLQNGRVRFAIRNPDSFREHFSKKSVSPKINDRDQVARIDNPAGDNSAPGTVARELVDLLSARHR
ncbi:MAG: transcription-repair coupling factor [Candidatus Brocadiia bacterium]